MSLRNVSLMFICEKKQISLIYTYNIIKYGTSPVIIVLCFPVDINYTYINLFYPRQRQVITFIQFYNFVYNTYLIKKNKLFTQHV